MSEQLFLENRATIDRIAAYLCRRNHLHKDEASDFVSEVYVRLIDDEYAIIRKFEGRSCFSTYLTTVIHRLFYQYRVERWGKWRPSAEARRLGDKAITLERLITRDGFTFEEACQHLTTRSDGIYTRRELEMIWARLPARHPRPLLVADAPAAEVAVEPEAEERARLAERAEVKRAAEDVIDRVLVTSDPIDRAILHLRFGRGCRIPEIGDAVGVDRKKVYKRIEKLLKRLRSELEGAGIRKDIIDDLLLSGDLEFHWTPGK